MGAMFPSAHLVRFSLRRNPLVRAWGCSAVCHAVGVLALALTAVAGDRAGADRSAIEAMLINRSDVPQLDRLEQPVALAMVPDEPLAERPQPAGPGSQRDDFALARVELSSLAAGGGFDSFGPLVADATASQAAARTFGDSARFYGIEADGDDFVFVVDMSGSMQGARFRRARGELRRSIEALRPPQRYFVIFFSDGPYPMPASGLSEATRENVGQTLKWINEVQCNGFTKPLPALIQALDLDPDAVFFLSDGKFDPQVAFEIGQHRTGDPIPIHTIGFMNRAGEPMLKAISEVTGGTYRFVR
jgi:hypothetical protein